MNLKAKRLAFDNGFGDIIDFTNERLVYQENDLMTQSWDFNKIEYATGITEITDFYKKDRSYSLTAHLWCVNSETEYDEMIDRITRIADLNVVTMTFGRLYFNNEYLSCRITGIDHEDWVNPFYQHKIKFTITADRPMWITERVLTLSDALSQGGLTFPFTFPFSFGTRRTVNEIVNPHYASSPFKITFYGYAVDPYLTIGGITYGINNLTLTANEYAVYDTFTRQIYKMSGGVKTDLFNNRVTKSGIAFTPVPAGASSLDWTRDFKASVTLYAERSLPAWVL